jgi:hypothetical protein
VALQAVQKRGWSLAVLEYNLGGGLLNKLSSQAQKSGILGEAFKGGEVITRLSGQSELSQITADYRQKREVNACLGVAVFPGPERQDVYLSLVTPDGQQDQARPHGGPPEHATRWAINHGLDLLRKL